MTIVHDSIAAQIAELEQLVPTPTEPHGFGVDLSCVEDITATHDEVDPFSVRGISEATIRRLSTARGTLVDDVDYGLDLRAYLSRGVQRNGLGELAGAVRNEVTKDDRIESATVTAVFAGTDLSTVRLQLTITPVDPLLGPFRLVLAITSAEVLLEAMA